VDGENAWYWQESTTLVHHTQLHTLNIHKTIAAANICIESLTKQLAHDAVQQHYQEDTGNEQRLDTFNAD